jgi:Zn-finger nucleic acid-binding protein
VGGTRYARLHGNTPEGCPDRAPECETRALETARDADAGATITEVDTNAPAACPVCGATMLRAPSPGTPVVIDVCAEHGTWFDHGELVLVVRALATQRGVAPPAAAADDAAPSSSADPIEQVGGAVGEVIGGAFLEGVFQLVACIFA